MTSATVTARVREDADVRPVRKRPLSVSRIVLHTFLAITALVWLAPVAWAVFTSFRPYADTAARGYVSIPHSLSIVNYRHAWTQGDIPLHFWNSMIITLPAIVIILLFASSVAFVVSRFSFWFNVPLLIFFMHNADIGRGAIVRNAIVDKDVQVAPGAQVGVDPEADKARFPVSPNGVVVIKKGAVVEA